VANVTLNNVVARHTAATDEQSCAFFAAQSGNTLSNITITNSTFSNGAGYGVQMKAGDANSNSLITGVRIENNVMRGNGKIGLLITTGMTALSEAKITTNARVLRNTFTDNIGPGAVLTIRGGISEVAYNDVSNNNTGALTGTGGLQLAGAYGVSVYGNTCNNNRTAFAYDGIGLYLDVAVSDLNNVGTEYCRVFSNICSNNNSYAPDAADVGSSNLSAGIATFKSHNNVICGNVCVGNAAGVCIGAWSINNQVYNNTLINNKFGVAILWNQPSHANVVQNNVVYGSTSHALIAPATGTRATTGNITLSGTTGLVTCTSTAADFTTHATGYAVSAGSGYGFVVSKTSNTEVVLQVLSAFSGTSFSHGNWTITAGGDQGSWSNYNNFFANAANVYLGAGQSVVVGANSQTTNPLLDASYRPTAASPCLDAGTYIPGVRHYGGKRMSVVSPTIGAHGYYEARSVADGRSVRMVG
jgi:parallel beta-helix repeat protein